VAVRDEDQVAAGAYAGGEEDGLPQGFLQAGRQAADQGRVGGVLVEAVEEEGEDWRVGGGSSVAVTAEGGRGPEVRAAAYRRRPGQLVLPPPAS